MLYNRHHICIIEVLNRWITARIKVGGSLLGDGLIVDFHVHLICARYKRTQ